MERKQAQQMEQFAAMCAAVAELKRKYGKPLAEIREWQNRAVWAMAQGSAAN